MVRVVLRRCNLMVCDRCLCSPTLLPLAPRHSHVQFGWIRCVGVVDRMPDSPRALRLLKQQDTLTYMGETPLDVSLELSFLSSFSNSVIDAWAPGRQRVHCFSTPHPCHEDWLRCRPKPFPRPFCEEATHKSSQKQPCASAILISFPAMAVSPLCLCLSLRADEKVRGAPRPRHDDVQQWPDVCRGVGARRAQRVREVFLAGRYRLRGAFQAGQEARDGHAPAPW